MIGNEFTERYGYNGYYFYSGKDITDKMIDKCFEIDKYFFKEDFAYNETRVREWIKEYGDMCSVLYNPIEDKVIAYCFYLFISDEALELYKQNKISFFTMGKSLFVNPQNGQSLNLFCLSDACLPGWDFVQTHKIMNEYYAYMVYELSKKQIKIKNVCIDVVCDYDKILANQFCIENKNNTNHNSLFVWGEFNPNVTWTYCQYSQRLIEQYKV